MMKLYRIIKDSSNDKKLLLLLLLAFSGFLLVAYLLAAFRSYVNADAGYYLGVTELIHQGYVPYRDFRLGYTPLLFYTMQIPRAIMGTYPVYLGYMLFLYVFVFLDAFLLALIVRKLTYSIKQAWLSGLFFLVIYYYLEGTFFVLEAFSLCFGLISILMIIDNKQTFGRIVLSGAFVALAFLAKQYGVLFAGVIGILLLFSKVEWKKRILNSIYATLGFCAVMALFVVLFRISGFGFDELINALSGSGYGRKAGSAYFEGVLKSLRLFPYLMFVPCLFIGKMDKERALIIACLTGILLASLQFYFNVFPHYFIYLLPFVLILNVLIWKQLKLLGCSRFLLLLYYGFFFTSVAIPMQNVYKNTKTLVKHDLRAGQIQTANQLRLIVDKNHVETAMCYWNTLPYYALCPMVPSTMEKYGFSFGYDTEETYCERLMGADCFVVEKKEMKDIEKMERFSQILHKEFPVVEKVPQSDVVVFIRDK